MNKLGSDQLETNLNMSRVARASKARLALASVGVAVVAALSATTMFSAEADFTPRRELVSEKLTEDGRGNLEKMNTLEALQLFESAVVADPKNVAAYVGLGEAYFQYNRPAAGHKYLSIALDIDPNFLAALKAQALAFIEAGELDDAEKNIIRLRRLCDSGCDELSSTTKAMNAALDEVAEQLAAKKIVTPGERETQKRVEAQVPENSDESPAVGEPDAENEPDTSGDAKADEPPRNEDNR